MNSYAHLWWWPRSDSSPQATAEIRRIAQALRQIGRASVSESEPRP